jgi:predicted enzyme related to lactoylglutathione lyase
VEAALTAVGLPLAAVATAVLACRLVSFWAVVAGGPCSPSFAVEIASPGRHRGMRDGGSRTRSAATTRTSYHRVMKTSGITAALPAQDLDRAKAFYVEKVGLQALESDYLKARDGQVGLRVADGVNQFFVYPARARSSGEFTQAVIHVTDVRAAVEEMRGRGVEFEEYDTPETRTENGVAQMPGGGEAAWFKDSEGNLVGLVPA